MIRIPKRRWKVAYCIGHLPDVKRGANAGLRSLEAFRQRFHWKISEHGSSRQFGSGWHVHANPDATAQNAKFGTVRERLKSLISRASNEPNHPVYAKRAVETYA